MGSHSILEAERIFLRHEESVRERGNRNIDSNRLKSNGTSEGWSLPSVDIADELEPTEEKSPQLGVNQQRQQQSQNIAKILSLGPGIGRDNAYDQSEELLKTNCKTAGFEDCFLVRDYAPCHDEETLKYRGQLRRKKVAREQTAPLKLRERGDSFLLVEERHGYGVNVWKSGTVYQGEWLDDRMNGQGCFWYYNGDVYVGQVQGNKACGFGVYITNNGSRYEGMWLDDLQEGEGQELWPDGSKYIGSYKRGEQHGFGIWIWPDGSAYKGGWFERAMSGQGAYQWPDGLTYQGQWVQNQMHGQGRMEWPDGRVYVGGFIHDLREGYGEYTFADGSCYKGLFRNN